MGKIGTETAYKKGKQFVDRHARRTHKKSTEKNDENKAKQHK